MGIIDLQRRMRELGRIRTGVQVDTRGGGKRPSKLETFRLTSQSRELIDAAAAVYEGEVKPWTSPTGPEWEVITKASVLDIVVPPGQSFSQWYELWSGGGCQRRCDGETNVLTMGPCECPADPVERRELAQEGEACKPTSRLNVILPALPDLGVWRLESHGFYAAVELAGSAEFLAIATQAGRLIPARLRLDQREKKVPGKPTNKYAVPVIEFTQTRIADLIGDGQGNLPQLTSGASGAPRLGAPEHPPAPALPEVSGFRAPPPEGRADDVDAGAGEEPSFGVIGVQPAATPPAADPVVADPAGMSRQELLEACAAIDVTPSIALAKAKELAGLVPPGEPLHPAFAGWPGNRDLSDVQRAVLAEVLRAERPAMVL